MRLSVEERELLRYFVLSGTYGTKEHVIKKEVDKFGKLGYIIKRAFLPMGVIKEYYPMFNKYKILLPFLPLYRLIYRWESAKAEIKVLKKC